MKKQAKQYPLCPSRKQNRGQRGIGTNTVTKEEILLAETLRSVRKPAPPWGRTGRTEDTHTVLLRFTQSFLSCRCAIIIIFHPSLNNGF